MNYCCQTINNSQSTFKEHPPSVLYSLAKKERALYVTQMNFFSTRLSSDQDLKHQIFIFFKSKQISAGVVLSAVGSLKIARLRFADQKTPTTLTGPFEILSLNGTLAENGVHLHLCISDQHGKTFGGHLSEGCLIHTTCELVIAEVSNTIFSREPDPQTNYMELKIK